MQQQKKQEIAAVVDISNDAIYANAATGAESATAVILKMIQMHNSVLEHISVISSTHRSIPKNQKSFETPFYHQSNHISNERMSRAVDMQQEEKRENAAAVDVPFDTDDMTPATGAGSLSTASKEISPPSADVTPPSYYYQSNHMSNEQMRRAVEMQREEKREKTAAAEVPYDTENITSATDAGPLSAPEKKISSPSVDVTPPRRRTRHIRTPAPRVGRLRSAAEEGLVWTAKERSKPYCNIYSRKPFYIYGSTRGPIYSV
mmetsp:Transcript_12437/g.24779  ORF Transcript_12437/g.24779 Transcript_12437/m.24779 type:complete len:261 (+) Transcript_12437:192-974(+)|eukprot:CAMPEP_0194311924 /NCGR_PEP_ID=MMETSP0171-20130528/8860_1 /TAXON_ID=218684 /ORGANISM="Corethron pennatum, Strain L29A3" /LENGTH=260 /DNA_ID=CAMNT_0039066229 /DNA_START=86 /DNA_END=868 /DNA_ORIENTATION=+